MSKDVLGNRPSSLLYAGIVELRDEARDAGVSSNELRAALTALARERLLLATMVAAELKQPRPAGAYARHEHHSWGIPGESDGDQP